MKNSVEREKHGDSGQTTAVQLKPRKGFTEQVACKLQSVSANVSMYNTTVYAVFKIT